MMGYVKAAAALGRLPDRKSLHSLRDDGDLADDHRPMNTDDADIGSLVMAIANHYLQE
jgi:hypothetical protein